MTFLFFSKKAIGLSVADRSIEVVEIRKVGRRKKIVSAGRVKLEPGIIEHGKIQNKERLAKAIRKVFTEAKPRTIEASKVIFGLPENQVYLHTFSLPAHEKGERANLIKKEILTSIPLQEDAIVYSYKILSEDSKRVEVLTVVANQEVVLEWRRFFQKLKIEIRAFDVESLATFRGVFIKIPKEPVCMIDIGSRRTTISIFDEAGLRYAYGMDIGGETFTKEIASTLRISEEEAENMKKKSGLVDQDERVFPILVKALQTIGKEARMSLRYFKEQTGKDVKGIILVGGSSEIKGIEDYFSTNLGQYVRLGKSALAKELTRSRLYIQAIGLALHGLDKVWRKQDPTIPILSVKAKKEKPKPIKAKEKNISEDAKQKFSLVADNEESSVEKIRMQKKKLLFILIGGLIILGFTYWYRTAEKERKAEELKFEIEATQNLLKEKENILKQSQPSLNIEPEKAKETNEQQLIQIQETPTGWLRVREGPETSYPILLQVYPGENYDLLEEVKGWYKIRVDEQTSGWVSSQYAQKVENS